MFILNKKIMASVRDLAGILYLSILLVGGFSVFFKEPEIR